MARFHLTAIKLHEFAIRSGEGFAERPIHDGLIVMSAWSGKDASPALSTPETANHGIMSSRGSQWLRYRKSRNKHRPLSHRPNLQKPNSSPTTPFSVPSVSTKTFGQTSTQTNRREPSQGLVVARYFWDTNHYIYLFEDDPTSPRRRTLARRM